MKPEGWDTPFDTPIKLKSGGELKTLRDAGNYVGRLPPREHRRPEWQQAAADLLQAATVDRAWRIFARRSVHAAIHGEARPTPATTAAARKAKQWKDLRSQRSDAPKTVAGRPKAAGRRARTNPPAD